MTKLPSPRLPLPALIPGDIETLDSGALIWRVYRTTGSHPATWSTFRRHGPVGTGRFDHHEPPAHDDLVLGILYGALDAGAALAEAFQDGRVIDRSHDAPWLACFALSGDTALLDLRGAWATRAGASQAISSGPRGRARAWSRAIHAAYPSLNGVIYPSAMAGESTNVALYERAAAASMPTHPALNIPLSHPGLAPALSRIAAKFGYGMR